MRHGGGAVLVDERDLPPHAATARSTLASLHTSTSIRTRSPSTETGSVVA